MFKRVNTGAPANPEDAIDRIRKLNSSSVPTEEGLSFLSGSSRGRIR